MGEPVSRLIEVISTGDDEIDAISLCMKAIREIARDDETRKRVSEYIASRFAK